MASAAKISRWSRIFSGEMLAKIAASTGPTGASGSSGEVEQAKNKVLRKTIMLKV
jgi:hypothetical protein